MNAGIYCRISSDRDGRGLGVARQEADCRKLCEQRGWEVAGVYVDNDISATSGKLRPEFQRLLADIASGVVDAVVCYHNDRLIRSPRELEDFIDLIDRAGAEVATVAGGEYDLSTGTGKMSARIVGAVARAESDRLTERLQRKHLELAQAGAVPGGGIRPFGYAKDRVTIEPGEAALVREAAARVLAGESVRSVCIDWNTREIPTVNGTRWAVSVMRKMLVSARIAGQREHRGVISDAVWPPIIDRATHTRLRVLLNDPTRRTNGNPHRYLLTGLVYCRLCDTRMVARPRSGGQRRYACVKGPGAVGCGRMGILAEPLEELVAARIFAAVEQGAIGRAVPDDGKLDKALARLADLEQRMAELATDYYADKAISRPQFVAASQRLTRLLEDAQRAVQGVSQQRTPVPVDLRTRWAEEPFGVRRAVVEGLVSKVTISSGRPGFARFDPHRVSIRWRT